MKISKYKNSLEENSLMQILKIQLKRKGNHIDSTLRKIDHLIRTSTFEIDEQNIHKQTALMIAIDCNSLSIVKKILSRNPNLSIKDR